MASISSIDAVSVARERLLLRVRVESAREFAIRTWLTVRLLRLIAWVSPTDVEVELVGKEPAE